MNVHDATEIAYNNGKAEMEAEVNRLKDLEEAHRKINGELRNEIKRLERALRKANKLLEKKKGELNDG